MIPKFRGFNKKTKKMYNVEGFKTSERKIYRCSLADDEFRSGRLETFHFVEDNLDNYILMQSTGLFDTNGVEIFEGDVVETMYNGKSFTGVIVYDKEETDFKATNGRNEYGNNFCYLGGNDSNIVIGNVHQHPDLLESVEE